MVDDFCVGATVRLPRPEAPKANGTATIATLQADDKTACVLWEPLGPRPLGPFQQGAKPKRRLKRRLKRPFLVTPLIKADENEETETLAEISNLMPLLEFESKDLLSSETTLEDWKERGDQLLRIGDASKACSYYERALQFSSILQVGSTVIVKAGGHAKLADVDCLEDDDDDAIEISMLDSGEEKIVKEAEVLFCILFNDDEDHLQERILLNLARCLLQLADLARHQDMASERRPQYLRSAVLATTLAMTISEHHSEDDSGKVLTKFAQTALLLRGQAQAGLGKFQNATADTKRLIQIVPDHKEGIKQLESLQGQQQKQKQVDKKLVKSMCSWVQKATTDDAVSEPNQEASAPKSGTLQIAAGAAASSSQETNTTSHQPQTMLTPQTIFAYGVLPVVIAYIFHKAFG